MPVLPELIYSLSPFAFSLTHARRSPLTLPLSLSASLIHSVWLFNRENPSLICWAGRFKLFAGPGLCFVLISFPVRCLNLLPARHPRCL